MLRTLPPNNRLTLLALTLSLALPVTTRADGPTLGTADSSAARPASDAGSGGGAGSGWSLSGLAGAFGDSIRRSVAGNPVTLTDQERRTLTGMRPALVELSGTYGRFNRADMLDVTASLQAPIAAQVRSEIARRKEANIRSAPVPFIRRGLANLHMRRHYSGYFTGGMETGNTQLRTGMEEFFQGVGVQGSGTSQPSARRNLDLTRMREFELGARTLQGIDRRRDAPFRVDFADGFGPADVDSLLADPNAMPPNGRLGGRKPPRPAVTPGATPARQIARAAPSRVYGGGTGRPRGVFGPVFRRRR